MARSAQVLNLESTKCRPTAIDGLIQFINCWGFDSYNINNSWRLLLTFARGIIHHFYWLHAKSYLWTAFMPLRIILRRWSKVKGTHINWRTCYKYSQYAFGYPVLISCLTWRRVYATHYLYIQRDLIWLDSFKTKNCSGNHNCSWISILNCNEAFALSSTTYANGLKRKRSDYWTGCLWFLERTYWSLVLGW